MTTATLPRLDEDIEEETLVNKNIYLGLLESQVIRMQILLSEIESGCELSTDFFDELDFVLRNPYSILQSGKIVDGEIAEKLQIIEFHVSAVFSKLKITDRTRRFVSRVINDVQRGTVQRIFLPYLVRYLTLISYFHPSSTQGISEVISQKPTLMRAYLAFHYPRYSASTITMSEVSEQGVANTLGFDSDFDLAVSNLLKCITGDFDLIDLDILGSIVDLFKSLPLSEIWRMLSFQKLLRMAPSFINQLVKFEGEPYSGLSNELRLFILKSQG